MPNGTLTIQDIIEAKRWLKQNYRAETVMPSPVFLPAWLYDEAKAQGIDMQGYVRLE